MSRKQRLKTKAMLLEEETPWNSFAEFPLKDWHREVMEDNTRSGYWAWVENRIDQMEDKPEPSLETIMEELVNDIYTTYRNNGAYLVTLIQNHLDKCSEEELRKMHIEAFEVA